jgi:DNA-binding Lrp family transcriptional regulator
LWRFISIIAMDKADRELINLVQKNFPVCSRPFLKLAGWVNLGEPGVIRSLSGLKKAGVIRRIGPTFDSAAMGFNSTLLAFSVPPGKVERAAKIINAYDCVTHNYLRGHKFNIWFTLTCGKGLDGVVNDILGEVSPLDWLNLPAERVYKIDVFFDAGRPEPAGKSVLSNKRTRLGKRISREKRDSLVGKVPFDIPLVPEPFPSGSISALRELIACGAVRKFGAVVDGRELGYDSNALVAWRPERGRADDAGEQFAAFGGVSHCYRRKSCRRWPYKIYTMAHAGSPFELDKLIHRMSGEAGVNDYLILRTVRRLKHGSLNVVDAK